MDDSDEVSSDGARAAFSLASYTLSLQMNWIQTQIRLTDTCSSFAASKWRASSMQIRTINEEIRAAERDRRSYEMFLFCRSRI